MRTLLITILSITFAVTAEDLHPGFYSIGHPRLGDVSDLANDADLVVTCDIGVGFTYKQGEYDTISDLAGAINISEKNLGVVWLPKSKHSKKEFQEEAEIVSRDFLELGFKRVVVLGASGSGIWLISDTQTKPKNSEQPKAQPDAAPQPSARLRAECF